jgi:hypothetical protein
LQKRNFLQKRFGKNSAQAKGDVSVVVFRRGMRISGRRVIASIECFAESLNGTLRFGVYDPATSEAHGAYRASEASARRTSGSCAPTTSFLSCERSG